MGKPDPPPDPIPEPDPAQGTNAAVGQGQGDAVQQFLDTATQVRDRAKAMFTQPGRWPTPAPGSDLRAAVTALGKEIGTLRQRVTCYRLLARHEIKTVKCGRRRLVPTREIDRYIDARTR